MSKPLAQIARIARRAALLRIGGEADLVVRDDVQRAAGRVAVEVREVERLGHDPLPRERGVAVDQDRKRDERVVDPAAGRPVGLLGPRPALDHRVDSFEVAWIRRQRDRHLAVRGGPRSGGREVVLDVAGAALLVHHDRVDRSFALELPEHRAVRVAGGVHEDVQPPAVGHADHDLVRSHRRRQLDRLVQHRHHRVEPLERELLLAEEALAEELLEPLGARERGEKPLPLLRLECLAVAARFDRLAQPDALRVIREVLDLVGDRPAVDLLQRRERLQEGLARHVDAQEGARGSAPEARASATGSGASRRAPGRPSARSRADRAWPRDDRASDGP